MDYRMVEGVDADSVEGPGYAFSGFYSEQFWKLNNEALRAMNKEVLHLNMEGARYLQKILWRFIGFFAFLKMDSLQLEESVDKLNRDITNNWKHTIRHTQEIARLERQVESLQSRLAVMENREAERVALEAVEGFEEHGDIETLFDALGRPEPLSEEVES